jgi:hypothetical protein
MKGHTFVLRYSVALLCLLFLAIGYSNVSAQIFKQPAPGDVYREFAVAINLGGDDWHVTNAQAAVNYPGYPASGAGPYPNPINHISIDNGALAGATRAEAVLTVWGGHVGTTGKQISFNGHSFLNIPELQTASPGQCYMQQVNVGIDVPLSHLQEGDNSFQGESGQQTCYSFGWGQWGLYGILVRVYYNPGSVQHVSGSITSPSNGASFGDNPTVQASVSGSADRVDFLAYYDGYDTDGDGVWADYHHDYHMPKFGDMAIHNHVGTSFGGSWSVVWDNAWVPDQSGVKMIARIHGTNGIWYVTQPSSNLSIARSQSSVVMFKPYNVGEREWAHYQVDDGVHPDAVQVENVFVPSKADASSAVALVRTWHGVDGEDPNHYEKFNDHDFGIIGDTYFAKLDLLDVPVSSIIEGENSFVWYSPVQGHHGIEILWPGPALLVRYGIPLPVQLASFTATKLIGTSVELKWTTLSETNNFGFEVERAFDTPSDFKTVANSFRAGRGTTLETTNYTFTDTDPGSNVRYYRLKQTDLNGSVHYNEPIRVDVLTSVNDQSMPTSYSLSQAYPNPFNPSTKIKFALPASGEVRLSVINQLGQNVKTLVQGSMPAGYHEVTFDAAGLPSGVYFYRIESGTFVDTKKMVLLK